jgi:tellurite resistance protein TerC
MMPAHLPKASATPTAPGKPRAAITAVLCVALGLGFGAFVWAWRGSEPAQQYISGYLIELSLSVDNVFVFALVFAQFSLGARQQQRLLFWGIIGAVVLRSAFILAGISAIARFTWLIPAFGAVILATAVRIAVVRSPRKGPNPSGRVFSFVTRTLPTALAALVVIETADLIFALDSLPAVLAVTHDAAIAISSNLFAILGLRSLYFVVSGAMHSFKYLNAGLAGILAFVGAKMLLEPWYAVPTPASLAVIALILGASIGASLVAANPRGAAGSGQ